MNLPVFNSESIALNKTQREAIVQFNDLVYKGLIRFNKVEKCFCGQSNFELLSLVDRFALPIATKICTHCGLISQDMQIDSKSLKIFYEKIYWPLVIGKKTQESSTNTFVTAPKNEIDITYILKFANLSKSKVRIFEVGCGSGLRIARLKAKIESLGHIVEAYGCDYSVDALNFAKNRGINTIHGGFEEMFKLGKADILILSHVFEHLPDLDLALQAINGLIDDDSIVYIEVPGVVDLENKSEYGFSYQTYCVLAHTYNFSLQSLANVMEKGGFRLVIGDEYVRSVFSKGTSQHLNRSAYPEIIDALNRAQNKFELRSARINNPFIGYFRNVAKALLNRSKA